MSNPRRVVVTGLGAVTSIGTNVTDFWKNLLAGTCGIRPFSLFDRVGVPDTDRRLRSSRFPTGS